MWFASRLGQRRRRALREPLTLRQALLLGALQGPTELLPISSSGHTTLVPWLLGWRYERLDQELRKAFEVALHGGTAAALGLALRRELGARLDDLDGRQLAVVAWSFAPPAIAGAVLERRIERQLGTPASVAAGLVVGAVAMALADLRGDVARRCEDARPIDGLWLGVAQACALIPGVSRNGATLAAARARGFDRRDANALSLYCAFPVVIGAVVLKSVRLARAGGSAPTHLLGAGAGAAFASTLVARPLVDRAARRRSLIPYFVYRVALAAVVICKLRENGRR